MSDLEVYHITTAAEWRAAQDAGEYRGDAFNSDGFIHCSPASHVLDVANARFRGRPGLVLLRIDRQRLRSEVRFEDLDSSGQLYPHIYGPLNLDAIIDVLQLLPLTSGRFELPSAVKRHE